MIFFLKKGVFLNVFLIKIQEIPAIWFFNPMTIRLRKFENDCLKTLKEIDF